MIKRNKYKMLAAALSTSFLLSACGSENTEIGSNNINLGYDGVYAQEYFEETSVSVNEVVFADKNIKNESQIKSETDIRKDETERNLSTDAEEVTSYEITDLAFENFLNVRCEGIDITIPCKIEDIDSRFDIEKNNDKIDLSFNGKYVGFLAYGDSDDLTGYALSYYEVNDLNEKSVKDDIQKKFGNGNYMDNKYGDCYKNSDFTLAFSYSYSMNTSTIVFSINNKEE